MGYEGVYANAPRRSKETERGAQMCDDKLLIGQWLTLVSPGSTDVGGWFRLVKVKGDTKH